MGTTDEQFFATVPLDASRRRAPATSSLGAERERL
jgi:hypothetical protein